MLKPLFKKDDKKIVRQALIHKRQALPVSVRQMAEAKVAQVLEAFIAARRPACVGTYMPVRGELDLIPLTKRLSAVRWALPVLPTSLPLDVQAGALRLHYAAWTSGNGLKKGEHDISIPIDFIPVEPDLVLLPCVGFNAQGFRLGYGGGWFDRTLIDWRASSRTPFAVGVAFACQVSESWRPESHDQCLDAMLTENGLQMFAKGV
jgi:5-formyltetrahydrofolate cyclo-ligase